MCKNLFNLPHSSEELASKSGLGEQSDSSKLN